jgi:hypothetical protein
MFTNKYWDKTAISTYANILATGDTVVVLFTPIKGGSTVSNIEWYTPFGIAVISLFASSLALTAISLFKHDNEISFLDKKALVEGRKTYLPKLIELNDRRLIMSKQIATRASKFTLLQYKEKYLNNTLPYLLHPHRSVAPIKILNSLAKNGFAFDNLHYHLLIENDTRYAQIVTAYNTCVASVEDKKLRGLLKDLWIFDRMANSAYIYSLLAMNHPEIRNPPSFIRHGYKGKEITEDVVKDKLEEVKKRIAELERGEDL